MQIHTLLPPRDLTCDIQSWRSILIILYSVKMRENRWRTDARRDRGYMNKNVQNERIFSKRMAWQVSNIAWNEYWQLLLFVSCWFPSDKKYFKFSRNLCSLKYLISPSIRYQRKYWSYFPPVLCMRSLWNVRKSVPMKCYEFFVRLRRISVRWNNFSFLPCTFSEKVLELFRWNHMCGKIVKCYIIIVMIIILWNIV